MKRILIIIIFFIAQKYSFSSDWITFVPAKTKDFSESFKKKMVKDLYPKLYKMLDDSISEADFEFLLSIGEINLKMVERNGYVFISAYLSTEYATQYPVTICYPSPDFKNKLAIHKSDITNKNVVFAWCDDFPKTEILGRLKPWKVITKEVSGYKFDIEYHTFTFPDIAICFVFDSVPTEQSLNAIEFEFKKYNDSNNSFFLHKLRKYKADFIISINYNTIDYSNYSKENFEADMNKLNQLFAKLNLNKDIINLKRIRLK